MAVWAYQSLHGLPTDAIITPELEAQILAKPPHRLYRYQRRIDGWRDAPLGRLYNPVYFNGGIAVHGAPSVPNRPASHGCVRIPMSVAEYFPGLVNNGDAIEVFRS